MISSIHLSEDKYKHYNTVDNDRKLQNFSKINIFIGSNNSGKSKFLRTLFSDALLQYSSNEIDLTEINKLIVDFKSDIKNALYNIPANKNLTDHFIDNFKEINFVDISFNLNDSVNKVFHELSVYNGPVSTSNYIGGAEKQNVLNSIGKRYTTKLKEYVGGKTFNFKLKNIYIPTLRGLRKINDSPKDDYLECTVKDYFKDPDIDGNIRDRIYTGLSLYDDTKKLLLGDKADRDKVKKFEKFLQTTFFNDQEINIIPRIGKDVVYFRIGEHEEHPIYDLGDGIQSIIVLTYPLFFRQGDKVNFFIEEPEHYLHPGFQRTFIETLLNFPEYQYFITTHSNHLLDLTLEKEKISVYTFKKGYNNTNEPEFTIENVQNEDSNILASIGVRNSSVFLSNCTIWVEGITDRIYLRKYLDVYQKEKKIKFKEDLHYSFVEYGGNNITHWSFLEDADALHPNIEVDRLCGKLFLITDKDGEGLTVTGNKTAKSLRQEQLKEKLNERYFCLKSREIENTLSVSVLRHTIGVFEKRADIEFKKNSFQREEDYQSEKLGNYIDKNVNGLGKSYADKSGTINDKLNFAKTAVQTINKESDLSKDALELTQKLYNFISEHNL